MCHTDIGPLEGPQEYKEGHTWGVSKQRLFSSLVSSSTNQTTLSRSWFVSTADPALVIEHDQYKHVYVHGNSGQVPAPPRHGGWLHFWSQRRL
jgi:hypothetical protein